MRFLFTFILTILLLSTVDTTADVETVTIFDSTPIAMDRTAPEIQHFDGYMTRKHGQIIEASVQLPKTSTNHRGTKRIVAVIELEPVIVAETDKLRIADPWTRIGSLSILVPDSTSEQIQEIELVRFATGFGGKCVFEQDVTAFGAVLTDERTFRATISTWVNPGWSFTLKLKYLAEEAGYRRPASVIPLISLQQITPGNSTRAATFTMNSDQSLPRVFVLSTGHGETQEFLTSTHILKVDGNEVARWRPWREDGGSLHELNPTSGRWEIDGRLLWSCDIDRAGWMPGSLVKPVLIPLPEIRPGKHTIEIEIQNIHRAEEKDGRDGYWITSVIILIDEAWPSPDTGQVP